MLVIEYVLGTDKCVRININVPTLPKNSFGQNKFKIHAKNMPVANRAGPRTERGRWLDC